MKYRKKPVVIEAVKWTGENYDEIKTFCRKDAFLAEEDTDGIWLKEAVLCVCTLEGILKASVGDYIIKGVDGEFYPCKPDIFEKTYEKVEDSEATKIIRNRLFLKCPACGWECEVAE